MKAGNLHDMDQSLSDDDYVASYWTWVNSYTEEELRKLDLRLTLASLRRMETITRRSNEHCKRKGSRAGCKCPSKDGVTTKCDLGFWI